MALPKTKISKARRATRSSANFKAHPNAIGECPQCHSVTRPHTVCEDCGYYKGVKVIETKKERAAKKADAKKA
jgi:large subunit ribosomal protein L32